MPSLATLQQDARGRSEPINAEEAWRYVRLAPDALQKNTEAADDAAPKQVVTFPAELIGFDGLHYFNGEAGPLGEFFDHSELKVFKSDDEIPFEIHHFSEALAYSRPGAHAEMYIKGVHERPLYILNDSRGTTGGSLRVKVAKGAVVDLIIVHALTGLAHSAFHVDIDLAEGAVCRVDECEIPSKDNRATLFVEHSANLKNDANLRWTSCSTGNALTRHGWDIHLHNEGAEAELNGAVVCTENNQAHHYVRMHHHSGNTNSRQLFKAAGLNKARYSFDGLVYIGKNCDNAHSDQQSSNLQLGDKVRMFARPQLDIHTDDVIAAHGCSTGQPDAQELFYLRSRGLSADSARAVIIDGFINEICERIAHAPLRDLPRRQLLTEVHHDD